MRTDVVPGQTELGGQEHHAGVTITSHYDRFGMQGAQSAALRSGAPAETAKRS